MKRSCPDYNTLSGCLRPLIKDASKPQLNNLALFLYGLVLTGHVHLPKIALCLPVTGNTRNALQRLERFLKTKPSNPPPGTKASPARFWRVGKNAKSN